MSKLKEYKSKRNLKVTPEPKARLGHSNQKDLLFVIHKHHATRLHYDFRLELDGVLKSWAIPKGPSLNPKDKRLAIMVEDHPFDYRSFEGVIPEGNYGAGPVMIWDEGTYKATGSKTRKESEKLLQEGLKKGHLDFTMNGQKLKGDFSLIRTRFDGSKENWLLIKKKDRSASEKDITKKDRSVLTDRTIEEIKEENEYDPHDSDIAVINDMKTAKIPRHISPMLSFLVKEPFDREGWLFEVKWDGYRAIAQLEEGDILLYSRNQQSFNDKFPQIVDELKKIKVHTAIFDGEIVIVDSKGVSKFQLMQNYQRTQKGNVFYYVFDLLYFNGHDLRELPLIERKSILKELLSKLSASKIRFSDHIEKKGIEFFKIASKKSLEGIMGKDAQSSYQMKRSRDWVKIKTHLRQEFVIGGFTQPRGSRAKFGSLLVGVYEGNSFKYCGHVGGGFTQKLLADVYEQLEPLIQDKPPFENPPKSIKSVTWVKPKLVCEVSFAEWTDDGLLRQPIFQGMRMDKKAKEVKREG